MVQVPVPMLCAGRERPLVRRSILADCDIPSLVAATACLLIVVDAVLPQFEMFLLGGHMPLSNVTVKFALFGSIIVGLYLHPRITANGLPISTWATCVVYLVFETIYLSTGVGMPLIDVVQSYNGYYLMLLIGPAALVFRHAVPERLIIRHTAWLFAICAGIGILQYLTGEPLVFVETVDGKTVVLSQNFFGELRAFGLCSSPMTLGVCCTLGGALGVALTRERLWPGIALTILAAIGTYVTLVRQFYLLLPCACSYSALMTFGKKPSRGLWQPLLYFAVGLGTLVYSVLSWAQESDPENHLRSASSVIERVVEWVYYSDIFLRSTPTEQLLGLGMVQNDKMTDQIPAAIDNLLLGIGLHIGIVGVVLFGVLLFKMWLYLRREALASRQPFIIAVVSVWATLWCSGIYYHGMLAPFGALFVLVILCSRSRTFSTETPRCRAAAFRTHDTDNSSSRCQ